MIFGDIVLFKNIVFENLDGTHEIDHAFNKGRPCVYIGEYDDSMYFLPITRLDDKRERKFFDIVIEPDKKINY